MVPITAMLLVFAPPIKADEDVHETVTWQAALDRVGFSPGVIDGRMRRRTEMAIRAFQRFAKLPVTGRTDSATRAALALDHSPTIGSYPITRADLAEIGPWPKTWPEKAKARRLGYGSLAALLAERGHSTVDLVRRLNPTADLEKLRVGDTVRLPNIVACFEPPPAGAVEIDFSEKLVHVFDKADREIALFHCSIAEHRKDRPQGTASVVCIKDNPGYLFDPKKWPEVKDVKRKLLIPPGPRSPVGLCWIGLSIPSYGIHGTPEPELIGRTGSHGCIRLTNWDALRLAGMVRVGTPVRFVERTPGLARAR